MANPQQQNQHVTAELREYFKEALTEGIVAAMEQFGVNKLKAEVETLREERLIRQGEERQKGKNTRNLVIFITAIQVAAAIFIKFYK